jgi:hypothetical protein
MSFLKLSVLSLLICTVFSSCKDLEPNTLPFSPEVWKTSTFRKRGQMVRSLVNQELLEGKSRSEVVSILGEPDDTFGNLNRYAIDFGMIHERSFQKYFLFIEYDANSGLATKVYLGDA